MKIIIGILILSLMATAGCAQESKKVIQKNLNDLIEHQRIENINELIHRLERTPERAIKYIKTKELIGKTISQLGIIKRIVTGESNSSQEIEKIITEYHFVDFDAFMSRTQVPAVGGSLRIIYEDGSEVNVHVFKGEPYTVIYQSKDGTFARFGMEK